MKVNNMLFIWPPTIPSYFNLCYNYSDLHEIASYFVEREDCQVKVIDGSTAYYSWGTIIEELVNNNYDVVAVYNHRGMISEAEKLCNLIKNISPSTKIIAYGRISHMAPKHFFKHEVDAVVHSGDFELGIDNYLRYLLDSVEERADKNRYKGLYIKKDGIWNEYSKGERLTEWKLANIDQLPLDVYNNIYSKENRISAFSNSKELTLTISRGCPTNCLFCDVAVSQGNVDRRKDVDEVINYIKENYEKHDFNLIHFSSPFFTLDREYCIELCNKIIKNNLNIKWKCVTRPDFVDKELLTIMAESGCKRIGFGVETFSEELLKKVNKKMANEKIIENIKLCRDLGIEARCFIMIGMPDQSKKDILETVQTIYDIGGKVRPTLYTPLYKIDENMSSSEIDKIDRQYVHNNIDQMEDSEAYKMIYSFDNWLEENINLRGGI